MAISDHPFAYGDYRLEEDQVLSTDFRYHVFQGPVVDDAQELAINTSAQPKHIVQRQTIVAEEALKLVNVLVLGVDVRPLLRLSLFVREVENIGFVLSRFGRIPEPNDAGIGIVQPGF